MNAKHGKLLALALLAGVAGSASPALALDAFIAATCGADCVDLSGEQAAARQSWEALEAMGTTDFMGYELGGMSIDAASLLAGARAVGATEIDRWLRTGQGANNEVLGNMVTAMTAANGTDVSRITGTRTASANSTNALDIASMGSTSVSSGVNGQACDPIIENAQVAAAQSNVNEVIEAAMSEEYGFTQVGGVSAGSDTHSPEGLFGGSCLDIFMTGDLDTLFRPPQLSQLVFQMGQMYGAEAQGTCAGAPTVFAQVQNSMPSAVFNTGKGGFFPAAQFLEFEGGPMETPSSGIGDIFSGGEVQSGELSTLFSRS